MSKCLICDTDMSYGGTCIPYSVKCERGPIVPMSIYEGPQLCHDCGCKHGGYHHLHCDQAHCPNCNGQIIGSKCEVVITND